jgi:hypothetical protein
MASILFAEDTQIKNKPSDELAKPLKVSVISSRNGQKRKTCSKNDKIELTENK